MKYVAPTTLDEAQALLAGDDEARVFAGATDLIPQIRAGRKEPSLMIDLKKIDRLCGIHRVNGTWVIGAATPSADLTGHAELSAAFPGLVEASGLIGSDQIQNRSTLGGNLCNASPAADTPPSLIVNEAEAVIATGSGTRSAAVAEVVTGPGTTSLQPGEFIVELRLETPPPGTADAYLRLIPRTEMDIAVVGAAARVSLDEASNVTAVALALGAVAPTVVTLPDAASILVGGTLDPEALAEVASAASAACDPINDKRGTIEYRRKVAGVLARRALVIAAERAAARHAADASAESSGDAS